MEAGSPHYDCSERQVLGSARKKLPPLRPVDVRRHRNPLRVCVPFAEIVDCSAASSPRLHGRSCMAMSLAFKEERSAPVCSHWLSYEQHFKMIPSSLTEENAASLCLPRKPLSVPHEDLDGCWSEHHEPLPVRRYPFAYELHAGHCGSLGTSTSPEAGEKPERRTRVRSRGDGAPRFQSTTISAAKQAACTDAVAGKGT